MTDWKDNVTPDDPPVYAIYARLSRKARGRRRNDRETVERQPVVSHEHSQLRWVPLAEVELLTMPARYKQSIRSWERRGMEAE